MEPARFGPRAQIFVCTNERLATDPLTSACGRVGMGVYTAVKRAVGAAGRVGDIWVTRTACLGHCPPRGCSVAIYPTNEQWIDATPADAGAIVDRAITAAGTTTTGRTP
jgi:(2Fe-2S) ferredoxin